MGSSAENILTSPGERQFPGSILHCLCLSISCWLRQLLNKSFTVTAVRALNVHPILHRKTGSLWQLSAAGVPFAITSAVPPRFQAALCQLAFGNLPQYGDRWLLWCFLWQRFYFKPLSSPLLRDSTSRICSVLTFSLNTCKRWIIGFRAQ